MEINYLYIQKDAANIYVAMPESSIQQTTISAQHGRIMLQESTFC